MRLATRVVAGVLSGLSIGAVGACGSESGGASPSTGETPIIVTFEVVGGERFKVLLTDPTDIDIAQRQASGEDVPNIPNGRIVRETGVNEGYSWSLDPNDFEFADVTIEVCDGTPADVEQGILTSERYCPWSAVIADIQPAP
jgi:hypothetical protein